MTAHTIRSLLQFKRLRWILSAIAVVALMMGGVLPAFANLSGSTFEGGDGNLTVDTTGNHDWNSPVQPIDCGTTIPTIGTNCSTDLTKSTSDNAFGQGTKEDAAAVTVVSGSIPPNKSDLTRFYVNSEFTNGSNFLYLAWERSNVLGSANMDFEINQAVTPGLGNPGPHTINRTAGDLLVTYDFGGSGTPTLGLLRWVTTGATSQCKKSNTLPCWGNGFSINSSDSEGAINTTTVTDTNPPGAPFTLPANTFGEVAINLSTAGVFPPGTCTAFGSAFLKSRSSAAFDAEVKDFIAPVPVNISNCGRIIIIKHTDPRGLNQSFGYTSNISVGQNSCANPTSFSLNDTGNTTSDSAANTQDCPNVFAGTYAVTEGAEPANFSLESLVCTATSGSSGSQDGANPAKANITVIPDGVVTCTYTNKASGAIQVTKTGKNLSLGPGQHPLAGATFTVNGVSKTTDANGLVCFDGLNVGQQYTVTETSAPTGYSIDSSSQTVTTTGAASCSVGTPTGVTFTDSPLTNLKVTASSVVPGATNSTITCVVSGTSTNIGNSPQGPVDPAEVDANGLLPGTYVCTIVVDP